jgi:hypothetical protein
MASFGLILKQPQIPQQVNNLFMGVFCSCAGELVVENCVYCLQFVDRIVLVNELLNTALYLCESVQHVLQRICDLVLLLVVLLYIGVVLIQQLVS